MLGVVESLSPVSVSSHSDLCLALQMQGMLQL